MQYHRRKLEGFYFCNDKSKPRDLLLEISPQKNDIQPFSLKKNIIFIYFSVMKRKNIFVIYELGRGKEFEDVK